MQETPISKSKCEFNVVEYGAPTTKQVNHMFNATRNRYNKTISIENIRKSNIGQLKST